MATVIGITGGIASGKSTLSSYLLEKGYALIDADKLVHTLQAPGGRLYQALVKQFGSNILAADGQLDRPKLAETIFSSPENEASSSQLQDQIIREELSVERDRLLQERNLVFLDIPLLFEKGYEEWCDQIWLVVVEEDKQLERLINRNGLSIEQAKQRVSYQWSLAKKKALADVLIDNNGAVEQLYQQVDFLLKDL